VLGGHPQPRPPLESTTFFTEILIVMSRTETRAYTKRFGTVTAIFGFEIKKRPKPCKTNFKTLFLNPHSRFKIVLQIVMILFLHFYIASTLSIICNILSYEFLFFKFFINITFFT